MCKVQIARQSLQSVSCFLLCMLSIVFGEREVAAGAISTDDLRYYRAQLRQHGLVDISSESTLSHQDSLAHLIGKNLASKILQDSSFTSAAIKAKLFSASKLDYAEYFTRYRSPADCMPPEDMDQSFEKIGWDNNGSILDFQILDVFHSNLPLSLGIGSRLSLPTYFPTAANPRMTFHAFTHQFLYDDCVFYAFVTPTFDCPDSYVVTGVFSLGEPLTGFYLSDLEQCIAHLYASDR